MNDHSDSQAKKWDRCSSLWTCICLWQLQKHGGEILLCSFPWQSEKDPLAQVEKPLSIGPDVHGGWTSSAWPLWPLWEPYTRFSLTGVIQVYVYMVKMNEMEIYLTQVTPPSAALFFKRTVEVLSWGWGARDGMGKASSNSYPASILPVPLPNCYCVGGLSSYTMSPSHSTALNSESSCSSLPISWDYRHLSPCATHTMEFYTEIQMNQLR